MGLFVAVLCLGAALVVDWWAVGRDSLRDRLAYSLALAGMAGLSDATGYRGAVSARVVDHLEHVTPAAGDSAAVGIATVATLAAGIVLAYSVGAMLPRSWRGLVGRFVEFRLRRPPSLLEDDPSRINRRLWWLAAALVALEPATWGLVGLLVQVWIGLPVLVWGALLGGVHV